MSVIVTIKKVADESKGDNKWKTIYYDKDGEEKHKAILLKEKYDLLVAGSTIEIIYSKEKNARGYLDIVDIKPATAQQAVSEDKSGDFATFHLRQKSIERQNALTNAVNFWAVYTEKSIGDILDTAEAFVGWTAEGIKPTSKPMPPTLQQAREAFDALPSMSAKTPEDFKKSVNDFCRTNKWTKKDLENFMKAHEKKIGKTDVSLLDTTEQVILLSLLSKEVK